MALIGIAIGRIACLLRIKIIQLNKAIRKMQR